MVEESGGTSPSAADDEDDEGDGGEEHASDAIEDESGDSDDDVAGMYDQSPGDEISTPSPAAEAGDGSDEDAEDGEKSDPVMDAPLLGEDDTEPDRAEGTFYVKHVEDVAVTLHDVNSEQIITLIENPGFEPKEIIEAKLVAQPPMEVSYVLEELEDQRSIPVEESPEPPTQQVQDAGEKLDGMEAVAIDREGHGEIHVLKVDPDRVDQTVEELPKDDMTYKNAARYEVGRVEVRSDEDAGIVSIRYLP
jgi:hypothetical protein